MHYVCEIDLTNLPRTVEAGGCSFPIPDLPENGTLQLFAMLDHDEMFDSVPVIIHLPDGSEMYAARTPPDTLLPLKGDDATYVLDEGVAEDGKSLIEQHLEAIPFLSAPAGNPLARAIEEADGVDTTAQDTAHDFQQAALGSVLARARRPEDAPASEGAMTPERLAEMPEFFVQYSEFEPEHMSWSFIFEFARGFLQEILADVTTFVEERAPADEKRRGGAEVAAEAARISDCVPVPLSDTAPVREADLPDPSDPFDRQAFGWLDLSICRRGRVPDAVQGVFMKMLAEIVENAETQPEDVNRPRIAMLDNNFPRHDIHAGYVDGAAARAFDTAIEAAKAMTSPSAEPSPAEAWDQRVLDETMPDDTAPHDFSVGMVPPQMFGAAYSMQDSEGAYTDHLLLLQLGDGFGTPIRFIDGDMVLKIWIRPEDLVAGEFGRIHAAIDMA